MLFQAFLAALSFLPLLFASPLSSFHLSKRADISGRRILVGGIPAPNKTDGNYAILEFNDAVQPNTLSLVGLYNTSDGSQKAWLSQHPTRSDIILASNDHLNETIQGLVTSYLVDPVSSQLTYIDSVDSGGITVVPGTGVAAAYTAAFPDGNIVGVANYYGASAATFRFDANTGKFGERINNETLIYTGYQPVQGQEASQDFSHPHQVVAHPYLPYVYIPDLGADLLRVYRRDEEGILTDVVSLQQPTGSAPRHVAISPNGEYLYLIYEATLAVAPYRISPEGNLTQVQTPQTILPEGTIIDYPTISSAEVHITNDGRFLYASARNVTALSKVRSDEPGDPIAVWSVSASTGELTRIQTATTNGVRQLRSFEFSPPYAAAQGGGGQEYMVVGGQLTQNAIIYARDRDTGMLSLAAQVDLPSFGPSTFVWL